MKLDNYMNFKFSLVYIIQQLLPKFIYQWLTMFSQRLRNHSVETKLNFGGMRRLAPISRKFGYDRGRPIDDSYTRRFGRECVAFAHVLHVTEGNPAAAIIGDLTRADHIPADTFDCIILTQTLQFIYDVQAALKTIQRILKPGGVVLATFPGISQIADDNWGDYQSWSFTTLSAQRLFEEVFPKSHIKIEACGNVLATIAFLQGLAVEELRSEELEYRDSNYELLITVRAVKAEVT
jgi:SAM-dependent methyltransferase